MSNDFASMMQQQTAGGEHVRTSTRLRPGQSVTGTVVQIGQDYVFVDIGATTEGRIDRRELEDKAGEISVQPGDSLRASVISVDDVTGPKLSVSFGRGRGKLDEHALEAARDARVAVEGVVGAAVKGGVEVRVLGARAFCPASQLSQEFVADLASFEGQKLEFLVLEVKNGGRDVIVSRKALLVAQQSRETERVLSELQVGGDYPAKVVSIQKYGAFVELGGGVEGLVHISELAHGRIDRVEDMLRVGEEVTVRLLALQPGEKGGPPKLRLSLRALSDAPEAKPEPERGEVLAGTVSKVTQFGVFVDTSKGTGLVPTRELGTPRNSDSRRMFPIGKEVSVVLVSKDSGRGLTFSMSRVADVEERQNFREFSRTQQTQRDDAASVGSFGALLRHELKLPDPPPQRAVPKAAIETPSAASAPLPPPAAPRKQATPGPAAAAPRGPDPRGPAPGDRTRIDRTPSAAPTPPKPEGNGSAANLGVVRGRRRPGDRG